jgi:hypothetical protein
MTWRQLLTSALGVAVPWGRVQARAAHAQRWRHAVHRSYVRLEAPSLCRPLGPLSRLSAQAPDRSVVRGLVVSSDEAHAVGELLELEVLADPAEPLLLRVRVESVEALPPEAPARYDILLQVYDADPLDEPQLRAVLEGPRPRPGHRAHGAHGAAGADGR